VNVLKLFLIDCKVCYQIVTFHAFGVLKALGVQPVSPQITGLLTNAKILLPTKKQASVTSIVYKRIFHAPTPTKVNHHNRYGDFRG
jgi:hypothetical protein